MRVLLAAEWRESNNEIASMAAGLECSAIVLCGNLGSDSTYLDVLAWARYREPMHVYVVPGPEDQDMPFDSHKYPHRNVARDMGRCGYFEFSGIDCIPDDGRLYKKRCRRDDDYFDFPIQDSCVPDDWPEKARELPTISQLLAGLPTPHSFRSTVYVLPAPYGATFCSEKSGEPCECCGRPFEPYVPINGSRAVRRFIEDHQPGMTVHPGREWSEKEIGRTKCVLVGNEPVVYDLFTRERVLY